LPALGALQVEHSDSVVTLDCSSWPSLTTVTVVDCENLTVLHGLEKLSLLVELHVHDCVKLEHIPELACLKSLQVLSVNWCPKLSSIYNRLTEFEVLIYLNLWGSGIGKAIDNNTDTKLVRQVSALKQRQGFHYSGSFTAYISDEDDDEEQHHL
jgi:hypothetical protein